MGWGRKQGRGIGAAVGRSGCDLPAPYWMGAESAVETKADFQARAWSRTAARSSRMSSRLEGTEGDAGLAHRLNVRRPKTGTSKRKSCAGFTVLTKRRWSVLNSPRAAEHGIGALEGLNGDDGALAHDHALADVEAGHLLGNVDPVLQKLVRHRSGCWSADRGGPARRRGRRGRRAGDAQLGNLVRDGAEDRLGVAAFQ